MVENTPKPDLKKKGIYPNPKKGPLGKQDANYLKRPRAAGKDKSIRIWTWIVFIMVLLLGFFWLMTSTAAY